MARPLTDRTIKAIKPGTSRTEIPDGGMPGLYIVSQPSGGLGWAYRFRSPIDGKPRKLTIGRYPAFGLADARKAAGSASRSIAEGRDPSADKVAARRSAQDRTDLVDALLNTFIARHVAKKKKSTAAEMTRLIEKDIRPRWKDRKIHSLNRRDVIELLDEVVERGAATTANRILAVVRRFGNWCVERGVLEVSPAAGVKAPSDEKSRDRVLSDDEMRWLWTATAQGTIAAVVRLLLVTGQRRGEVAGMSRQEIHDRDTWHIPPARTKNGIAHTVPLTDVARRTIASAPTLAGSSLIFTTSGETPVSGWSRFKRNLDAEMLRIAQEEATARGFDMVDVSIPPWRLHDLRRTAASGMARLGQPVHVVEALLNHKSGTVSGVAAVYNRYDYAEEKRGAANAWSAYLETLLP